MSGLARLWRLLTDAPTAVSASGRRLQIQLLSGLLVVLIPLGLLSIGVQLLLFPGFWPTFVAVASALVVLLFAYGLARAGKFTAGALLTVATSALTCFAIVILNPHDPVVYAFLNVSMFLARLLFDKTGVWVTTLANLLGVTLLLPALGVPPPGGDPVVVPIFLVITAALLLLGTRYRDAVERDRQMELVVSEARFRDFADATLEGVVFTENGSIIDINERGAALLGAARSAVLIGRDILEFCAPVDRERVATLMRNDVTTPYEFSLRRMDGSEFPAVVRGRTSLYHNRPVRVTVFRDLTERMRAEEELRHEREFTSTVFDTAGSLIVVLDRAGRIVRFNRTAEQITGYRFDEVRGQTPWDYFLSPAESASVETVFKRLTANDVIARYENHWRMRDGSYRLFDWSNRVITDSAGTAEYIVSVGVDITERKRDEQVTQRLNRLLNTLGAVNPALVRAESEAQLFAGVCRTLVEQGEFSMAWVGLADTSTSRVKIACQSGFTNGYLENLDIRFDDSLQGQGPTGEAIRTGRTILNEDTEANATFAPWLERSREHGHRSSMATPLRVHGQVIGSLNVYAATPHAFGNQEVVLLEKLAGDIGMALERLRAEQALRESEVMLASAQEMTHLGSWRWQVATGKVTWSDEMYRIYGVSPDTGEVSFERAMAAIHPDDRALVAQQVQDMLAGKDTDNYECRIVRPDGVVRNVWARSEVQRDVDGSPQFVIGTVQDITGHKRAEQALRDSETRYRTIVETAQEGIWQIDADSRTSYVNRKMAEILGYTVAEMQGRSLLDFMDEEGRAMVAYNVERRKQGIAEQHEFKFRHKDGATVWAELNTTPQRNADGSYAGALAMVTDITERRRAEQALREGEAKYRQLFENMTSGFALHEILCDAEGKPVDYRYLQANPAFEKLTGVPVANLVGKRIREILPNTEDYWIQIFGKVALTGEPMAYENFSREIGKYFDTWVFSPQKNQFAVIFTDITKRKVAEAEMLKLSSALEQTADSVVITDREGVIEYVNLGFEKTTGYSRDDALGQTPSLLKSGKQGEGFYKKLWQTILAGEVFNEVFVNRRKDGSLYYAEETISPLKNPAGLITHFVATGKDVTERMQAQERLQHMAQHDALTELPNRVLFLDRLKQGLARARWHERLVAVLFIDLDRFKTINDTLGHEVGDKLLQALAERFSASVREGDTVARFGGDEFVMLLDDVATEKDVGAVAQKVLETLAPPFTIDGQELYVTASIGVSLYPNDGEDSGTLLKNADIAMYRAKEVGKNTYQFYSSDMSARAFERLTLESSLRRAIERNEFRLYYQPQIDTATGTIYGLEALLRWQHPDFGLVAPAEFVPLLEETGLIVPVGDWVIHAACEQLRVWHAADWPRLRMAVNLSPRQFQTSGLAMTVERGLSTLGCDAGLLELEITENIILQHTAATLETLEALHALGVRLAIDDFGTGYSSLSYLRRYAIDTLKIDRSFVHDVPGDVDDSALASAIIVLAQSLNLEVIAEGVETVAQRDFLQNRGCRIMQGNLYSRPLSPEDMTRLLNQSRPQIGTDGRGGQT